MMKDNNQMIANKLHDMWDELTPFSRDVIADTDIGIMAEVFEGLETPEQVNEFIEENYGG